MQACLRFSQHTGGLFHKCIPVAVPGELRAVGPEVAATGVVTVVVEDRSRVFAQGFKQLVYQVGEGEQGGPSIKPVVAELKGSQLAAGVGIALEHLHVVTLGAQPYRSCQPSNARSNDNGLHLLRKVHPQSTSEAPDKARVFNGTSGLA